MSTEDPTQPNVLSSAQFAQDLMNPDIGGGSRRFVDKTTADEGYFVSRFPRKKYAITRRGSEERRYPGAEATPESLSDELERTYQQQREPVLRATPSSKRGEVYQGGWEHEGDYWTDVSDRFPRSLDGLKRAMRTAERNRQIAAFALHSFTEIPTFTDEKSKDVFDNAGWVQEAKNEYGVDIPHEVRPTRPRIDAENLPTEKLKTVSSTLSKGKMKVTRKKG